MAGIGGGAVAILFCFGQGQKIEAQNSPGFAPGDAPPNSEATPSVTPTATPTVAAPQVSPRVAEIAKLVQSGVSDDVLMAFIKNSPQAFSPTADEILYLTDLGMPDAVLTVLMQHRPVAPEMTAPPVVVAPPAPAPVIMTTNIIVNTETRYVQAAPATVTTFYEPLRPYGSWVEVEDYGLCWQPTVVVNNRDWRPYSDRGRWVYTYSGWYWQSDYSWGWAPFHYGRWHSSPSFGWVWSPDRVWAPAWVSWRYNDDYCGWAPLPPSARFEYGSGFSFGGSAHIGLNFEFGLRANHYNFVPTSRFHDRSPSRYVVHGDQINHVYNNSTVINNYSVKNNTTVINEGIGRDRIAAATHTRIEPVALRQTASAAGATRRDVLDKQNNTLLVYRPPVDSTRPNANANASTGVKVNGNRAGRQEMIKLDAPIEKGSGRVRPNAVPERQDPVRAGRNTEVKNPEAINANPDRRPVAGRPANQGRNYSGTGNDSVNNNNASQPPVSARPRISENAVHERPETVRAERNADVKHADAERRPVSGRPANQGRNYSGTANDSVNNNNANPTPVNPRARISENPASTAAVTPAQRPMEKIERPAAPSVRNYPGSDVGRAPVADRSRESSRVQMTETESPRVPSRIERPTPVPSPQVRNAPEMGRALPTPTYSTPPARSEPVFRPQPAPSLPQGQPLYRSEAVAPPHGGQWQNTPAYRAPAYQPPAPVQRQAPVYSAPPQNNSNSRGDIPPNYRQDTGGRKFRNDQ